MNQNCQGHVMAQYWVFRVFVFPEGHLKTLVPSAQGSCPEETLPGHEEPCMLSFQVKYSFPNVLCVCRAPGPSSVQTIPAGRCLSTQGAWRNLEDRKLRALGKVASHVVLVRNYFWSILSENDGPLWAAKNSPSYPKQLFVYPSLRPILASIQHLYLEYRMSHLLPLLLSPSLQDVFFKFNFRPREELQSDY